VILTTQSEAILKRASETRTASHTVHWSKLHFDQGEIVALAANWIGFSV